MEDILRCDWCGRKETEVDLIHIDRDFLCVECWEAIGNDTNNS